MLSPVSIPGDHVLDADAAIFERLEPRRLLSQASNGPPVPSATFGLPGPAAVWVQNRTLYVTGSRRDDVSERISVSVSSDSVQVNENSFGSVSFEDIDAVVIHGRSGSDQITLRAFGAIAVTVDGGIGDDTFEFTGTTNGQPLATLLGGAGDDRFTLELSTQPGELDGGDGIDEIIARERDSLDLNDFANIENGQARRELIGTDAANRLTVVPSIIFIDSEGNVVPTGIPGFDDIPAPATVRGGGGDDTITGHFGHDQLFGDVGNDHLMGDEGRDMLDGGAGDDKLEGQYDDDSLSGRSGRDRIYGGDGRDRLNGNGGRDWLFGESEVDRLYGGEGDDYLDGGSSNDRLQGDGGADEMHGNSGNDRFFSRDSTADQLFGGRGENTATCDVIDLLAQVGAVT